MISFKTSCSLKCRVTENILRMIFLLLTVHALSPSSKGSFGPLDSGAKYSNVAEIDKIIEASAFESFRPRKTGIIYDVTMPSSLAGLRVQVVRLRSGSLRRRGFTFNEFVIPSGAVVDGSPRWVAMVYRDFGGLGVYAPEGYTLVAPVLGIKVYNFTFNLTGLKALPELNLVTGSARISSRIPYLSLDRETIPYCAAFDKGIVTISNVSLPPNLCSSTHLGDFSLVVPSFLLSLPPQSFPLAPSYPISFPSPTASAVPFNSTSLPTSAGTMDQNGHKNLEAWKIALAIAACGILLWIVLSTMVVAGIKYAKRSKISRMEYHADLGEVLQTALIGKTRAPAAGRIRTRPTLEDASET
ncbi:hypothetical protein O6H91_02G088000 [Diphasiastrum complanatum]|uniref:Uncharacterized protein n=1 Tax=Diphasiastrum complanatum TaxID=34168 RepID=A0ACC2EI15_DIPCM|nr:hypothetical protein O6H91_02G088000 [Diphasiastrum complanatum]